MTYRELAGNIEFENAKLRSENERLRAALRPFAEKAKKADELFSLTLDGEFVVSVPLGDCRRAAEALKETG